MSYIQFCNSMGGDLLSNVFGIVICISYNTGKCTTKIPIITLITMLWSFKWYKINIQFIYPKIVPQILNKFHTISLIINYYLYRLYFASPLYMLKSSGNCCLCLLSSKCKMYPICCYSSYEIYLHIFCSYNKLLSNYCSW